MRAAWIAAPISGPLRPVELTGLSVSSKHNNWFDAQSGLRIA